MCRKIKIYIVVLLVGFCALFVVQFKLATYVVDNYLDTIIAKVHNRFKDVNIRYEFTNRSFSTRDIRFFVTINRKFVGEDKIEFAFDLKLNFGFLRVMGVVENVDYYGNYTAVMEKLHLMPIIFKGAFNISPLNTEFALKSSSFAVPMDDGRCLVGENSIYVGVNGINSAKVTFASAGLRCLSTLIYQGSYAYDINIEGMAVDANPTWSGGRVNIDGLDFRLKKFDSLISTIYALGFSPEDKVLDGTLSDRFIFENIGMTFSSSDPDDEGFSSIDFDLVGDYSIAVPYIKKGTKNLPYRLDELNLNFQISKINLYAIRELLRANDDNFMEYALRCISTDLRFDLNNFSFKQYQADTKNSGRMAVHVNKVQKKIEDVTAEFNFKADKALVEHLARELGFVTELEGLVQKGAVYNGVSFYETKFLLQNKNLTLNGVVP